MTSPRRKKIKYNKWAARNPERYWSSQWRKASALARRMTELVPQLNTDLKGCNVIGLLPRPFTKIVRTGVLLSEPKTGAE
jgi:hypothetical protein